MNVVLSIVMLAAIALVVGAFFMWKRTGDTKKAILMVFLAGIAALNVAIWTVPDASGDAPIDKIADNKDS